MRYATIKKNDIANGPGIGVSFFMQGCPHHCKGCFNPETWDRNGGYEFTKSTMDEILSALTEYNIPKHLSILGGEPLAPYNLETTWYVIQSVRTALPRVKIFLWTGYTLEQLVNRKDPYTHLILSSLDCIIDGPYEEDKRDISLFMRGSTNQRVIYLKEQK